MLSLIRTEMLKVRTVRSPWLLLAASPLLVVAGISGLVLSGGKTPSAALQSGALAHVGLTSIFTLVFGILAVAGEYRHKTISDAYLSTPSRGRVIGAKLVVYAVFGALSGVLSSLIGVGAAAAWWSDKGAPFAWANSQMWTTIGGSIAWNAAFAAIGVGVGALIRNLVGAIAVALAWVALVEGVIGQLIGSLARWLPFSAGQALGAGAGTSGNLLSRGGGGAVLAVYTLVFAMLAVATTMRRDVP